MKEYVDDFLWIFHAHVEENPLVIKGNMEIHRFHVGLLGQVADAAAVSMHQIQLEAESITALMTIPTISYMHLFFGTLI